MSSDSLIGLRDRDVAGQVVVRHAAVGAALDVGVAAQRVEPAARPADVAEQQLQHRRRVNELHRVAVVRPAERVHDRARRDPRVYVDVMSSAAFGKSSALQPQMFATTSGV